MSDQFKAVVLNQAGENFTREIKRIDKSFFKSGDVLVKVDYSSLNYKDALILRNGGKRATIRILSQETMLCSLVAE